MKSSQHILLAKAKVFPRESVDLQPANCYYDTLAGAWVDRRTGKLFVELADMKPPRTKKADVETGEDQKWY